MSRISLKLLRNERGGITFGESLALKIVSLLLAIILWISILGLKREELKTTVPLVPLVSPNMAVASPVPSIQFTLSGPRVLLKDVEHRIKPIYENLSEHKGTIIPIAINAEMLGELPVGVRVESFTPQVVSIRLESRIQRQIPVKAQLTGLPSEGYEISKIQVLPKNIAVSGPKSLIEDLEFVDTEEINVDGMAADKEAMVGVLVDLIGGLQLVKERDVKVRVFLRKKKP